jgi:hypothetical protein
MTILGTKPPAVSDSVRPKDAERILAGELLAELRHMNATATEHQARLQSQVVNGVLEAGTYVLDFTNGAGLGVYSKSYHSAIGAMVVTNATGAVMTLSSAAPLGQAAPVTGQGTHIIPSNSVMTVPIGSHAFTLYGAGTGTFSIQVWTGLQPYGITT